jgi:CheY-specific phosphatase CheX
MLKQWMTALLDSAEELARTSLGWELSRPTESVEAIPGEAIGGCVALVGDTTSAQIGLIAAPSDCQQLCKALMAGTAEDPDLEESEMVDALCEMANIMAGCLKGRLEPVTEPLKLGLPLFVRTPLRLASRQQLELAPARLGPVETRLMLIHPFVKEAK